MITQAELDNFFVYHQPRPGQNPRYVAIREAAKNLAEVIVQNTAPSADQSAAIRKVREAVMTANQGIACEEVGVSELIAYELGLVASVSAPFVTAPEDIGKNVETT